MTSVPHCASYVLALEYIYIQICEEIKYEEMMAQIAH